jgi:NADPH-dependent 2,4-dienoyl-CoA reductase/sulfur reductase-like enzyme/rhodanese-related sulfurtransferase
LTEESIHVNKKTIVVVGGVAGGMSFATRYRRLNPQDDIIIFEKGPYVSFANCGLPYYMSGEIPSRTRLLVVKEKDLVSRFRLDIRSQTEVTAIDVQNRKVHYVHQGITQSQAYDELILSPGAKPIIPIIPGLDGVPHFELRNIPHLDAIMAFITDHKPAHVGIVGAGYIGLEVAENLQKKGLHVSVIEKSPHIMPVFDPEIAAHAHQELVKHGVDLYPNDEIINIVHHTATLKSGKTIPVDFLILAVGVLPESTLATNANLATGLRGGILVNHQYQTSAPHVYAIGDAIVVKHHVTGDDALVPLASPANRQGRQLADILSGLPVTNKGSLGTAIVRLFDVSLASTGLNERQVQLAKRPYQVVHVHGYDHVSYFPGATTIDLKLIYDPNTELMLGAQAVGIKGVDKRIDVIATAIKAKLKVTELQELELTYAPPFGSAKDLVNVAGYVAQNQLLGISRTIQWHQLEGMIAQGVTLLDVRPMMERMAFGHLPNDLHLELEQVYAHHTKIPKDKPLVVYCDAGSKAYNAEQILKHFGYDVYLLDGGYNTYTLGKGTK